MSTCVCISPFRVLGKSEACEEHDGFCCTAVEFTSLGSICLSACFYTSFRQLQLEEGVTSCADELNKQESYDVTNDLVWVA